MKWIKCSEQMPEYNTQVIGNGPVGMHMVLLEHGAWDSKRVKTKMVKFKKSDKWGQLSECCYAEFKLEAITHWMPLPEKPE